MGGAGGSDQDRSRPEGARGAEKNRRDGARAREGPIASQRTDPYRIRRTREISGELGALDGESRPRWRKARRQRKQSSTGRRGEGGGRRPQGIPASAGAVLRG